MVIHKEFIKKKVYCQDKSKINTNDYIVYYELVATYTYAIFSTHLYDILIWRNVPGNLTVLNGI